MAFGSFGRLDAVVANAELDDMRQKFTAVNEAEGPITDLQRKKTVQEDAYMTFSTRQERGRFDEFSKSPNIRISQPTA